MKCLRLAVLAVIAAGVQAVTFSSLTALSLVLLGMNKPVMGFFGFFRRRSPKPASIMEEMSPQGPVEFPSSNLLQSGGFFSPFAGVNRDGFFPFQNFPASMFQQGIPQIGQPWNSQLKRPSFQQQPGQFPPQNMPFQQQPGQFPPQNMPFQQQPGQFPPQNMPFQQQPGQFPPQKMPFQQQSGQFPLQKIPFQPPDTNQFEQDFNQDFDSDREVRADEPQINTEEAESFFTLLAETDENKCISRLVCEMGADPVNSGMLGTTVSDIIGSLTDFPEGSKVQEYNQVLQKGRTEGLSSCLSNFPSCDEESYQLMKNSQNEEPSDES